MQIKCARKLSETFRRVYDEHRRCAWYREPKIDDGILNNILLPSEGSTKFSFVQFGTHSFYLFEFFIFSACIFHVSLFDDGI